MEDMMEYTVTIALEMKGVDEATAWSRAEVIATKVLADEVIRGDNIVTEAKVISVEDPFTAWCHEQGLATNDDIAKMTPEEYAVFDARRKLLSAAQTLAEAWAKDGNSTLPRW